MSNLEIVLMLDTAILGALALIVYRLYKKVNVWVQAIQCHTPDEQVLATPQLVRVWKKQIRRHEEGSPTWQSYRDHLDRAGE